MRTRLRALLSAAVVGIVLSVYACGAGVSTGVYVGVAVPGPYVGYPGVGYPGYVGRPPYVYEEDALNLPAKSRDWVAASGSEADARQRCVSESHTGIACNAEEQEPATTQPADDALSSGPESAGGPGTDG